MPKIDVYNIEGKKVSDIELADSVFGIEPNEKIVHSVLVNYMANQRQGTSNTKTRAEVSGGGRKPWKQKGTGRARAGSTRSPLFAGGGVSFGPKPRDYSFAMPQKARKLALKSALSAKLSHTIIVKDFSAISEPKTKLMMDALKSLKAEGKILIIADTKAAENKYLELSARNIPSVKLLLPSNLNVKDLIEADTVLLTESSVNEITERLA